MYDKTNPNFSQADRQARYRRKLQKSIQRFWSLKKQVDTAKQKHLRGYEGEADRVNHWQSVTRNVLKSEAESLGLNFVNECGQIPLG